MTASIRPRRLVAAAALALAALAGPAAAQQELVWGKPAEVTSLNVHVDGTVASWEFYQMVYETLLQTDADLALQPGLLSAWEQTSPTTYKLTLREGAAFSNGRPVGTADVIGTLERITDPETASYWARQFGVIESLEATGPREVTVTLAAPHTAFLPALAHISAAVIPVEEWKAGSFDPATQILGSGPYRVARHDQDERWVLEANPHLGDRTPKVATLRAEIIPDESARIAALRAGRIDFTTFENPDIALLMKGDANVTVTPVTTTNYYRIDVNALSDASAFKDKRVRQAMNLAIDRDALAMLAFGGATVPDQPVPVAFGKDACAATPTYALDRPARLERARALLAEAGTPAPAVKLMASSANPTLGRIAQVMQQSLAEAGFEVEIEQVPTAEYLQRVFTDGTFDAALSWLAGYTDPSMVIAWWNPKFALWNGVFHAFDEPLAEALETVKGLPDGPERDAALTEICAMIDDGANILALVSKVDYLAFRNDRIKAPVDARTGSSSLYRHIAQFERVD